MNNKQLKAINHIVLILFVILNSYLSITFLLEKTLGALKTGTLIQLIVIVISLLSTIIIYNKEKSTDKFIKFTLPIQLFAFAVLSIFNTLLYSSLYSFILLITPVLYLDNRKTTFASISLLVSNIMHFVIYLCTRSVTDNEKSEMFVIICVYIITSFACVKVSNLMSRFQKEKIDLITKKADEQLNTSKKMKEIAEDLIRNFEKSQSISDELENIVDVNHTSMANIAISVEDTAKTIEKQSTMTMDIKNNIEDTEQEAGKIVHISTSTSNFANSSLKTFAVFKEQASKVDDANKISTKSINNLSKSISEVENITKSISQISDNTSLLALNASIEAARAGEAGKGFAVVAEQIRTLSEETNAATNKITNIISELVNDIKDVTTSVENSTESVEKQNDILKEVDSNFNNIIISIKEMNKAINNINNKIHNVNDSNTSILEHISNLSATSEEVAASSQESLKVSEKSVSVLNEFKEVLNEIFDLANLLKEEN